MRMRWTFRCYPTSDQAEHLNRTFGFVRYVWNWALRMRTDAYRAGERINHSETDGRLTALERQRQTVWLNEVSSVCLQQALRDQQQAFAHFFDKGAAYPAFKRKAARQSANYTSQGFSFDAKRRTPKLAKIGALKVCYQRRMARQVKGSRRRDKTCRKIARIHERIADSRADALHKLAHDLLRRFDVIYLEDLNVRGMVKTTAWPAR